MFPFPPLSVKSILYTIVGVIAIGSYIYIKNLQYTISDLQSTVLQKNQEISSLNSTVDKYRVVTETANKLEEDKKKIQSSFSSVESELEKLKRKKYDCPSTNKDGVPSHRIITDDIARVLSLSDCKVRGESDCDSKYAEGRVFHIYTP